MTAVRYRLTLVCMSVLVIATGIACFLGRKSHHGTGEVAAREGGNPRSRPATVYHPKVFPLRSSPRPDLGVLSASPQSPQKSMGHGKRKEENSRPVSDSPDSKADEEEVDVFPSAPILPDDPGLASMGAETRFSGLVWSIVESPPENLAGQALALLDSENVTSRILASVLLFLENALDDELVGRIASDSDPLVPLVLLDWVRDFGTAEEIASLQDAISEYPIYPGTLFDIASTSADRIGGGRSALDLWLAGFAGGELPGEALSMLVTSSGSSYDVRAQAFFKLLEPETFDMALESLDSFAKELDGDSGMLWFQTAEKWRAMAAISGMEGDSEKVWDSQAAVVFYLAESDLAMPARDLANYLEYALRRDDPEYPPIIEEGTWEFANDCFNRLAANQETLAPEEMDALDRIAMSLDRLVAFDPAFNPFEEVDDDEEAPEDEEESSDEIF